ncbi:MAG: F0F1 ATP synthase assembly protein I [Methylococcales bacterium]|nr:MAG: F0F1 ATP synthase assembly protein I [Methylococcales bacterium]
MSIIHELLCLETRVTSRKFSTVSKILSYQLLIILIITAGLAVYGGMHYAMSSALGGVAAFVPNLYFALRIHKAAGLPARKVMNSFYAGESGKLILTAALFVIIFKVPNITILPLLIGYITALSVFWFALLMR